MNGVATYVIWTHACVILNIAYCHHSYRPCDDYQRCMYSGRIVIQLWNHIGLATGAAGSADPITIDTSDQEMKSISKDVTCQCIVMIIYVVYLPQECLYSSP